MAYRKKKPEPEEPGIWAPIPVRTTRKKRVRGHRWMDTAWIRIA